MRGFRGVSTPGGWTWVDGEKERLRRHLHGLAPGPWEVPPPRRPKTKRSLRQNAYWHVEPFPKLAAAMGESVARVKLLTMGEFWGYEPCGKTGLVLPVKAHTSEMTVQEGTTFLDWLIPWALEEYGVAIRLPDDVTDEELDAHA